MPAAGLLKLSFLSSAFGILLALYGLVDSVGGLMFAPTHHHHTEDAWVVQDSAAAASSRNTAKKHIGVR